MSFYCDSTQKICAGSIFLGLHKTTQVERTRLGVMDSNVIDPRWQLSVSLSSEEKKGTRLFGIDYNCPSAVAPDCGSTIGTEVGWAVADPARTYRPLAALRRKLGRS